MTTATRTTSQQPKVCGQTFASLATLGILAHFAHERATEQVPAAELAFEVAMVGAVLALTAAWYRLGGRARRVLACVLGAFWAAAASEHVLRAATGGTFLDLTGLLTFAGGLLLIFAAYWDFHRPLERSL